MYRHGATCLPGPVSKRRVWWIASGVEIETTGDTSMSVSPSATAGSGEHIRHELVARIRREIAEGTYDNSHKWEIALARLLDRVGQ